MTDVLKSTQRRSSTTYFALPIVSFFRRRHSTQTTTTSHKTSPPSPSFMSNDLPSSEVIDIGQSSSTSQHTNSHADEPLITSPEDEERQRLRDAAAHSLGLDLNVFDDDNPQNGGSTESSSPSLQPSRSSNTISYSLKASSLQSGLLSSLATHSPHAMGHGPQPFMISAKPPPYPCSYSELAPFIQISSSYLKFVAGSASATHTASSLAFISLPKRHKSAKIQWKLYYVVLTVPREYGYPSAARYSIPPQSPPGTSSDNNSLASSARFRPRNSPPPSSSTFMPSHSHLHLFKSEHPTRDELEIDRLEINEDTVVYIADMELAGKKGLIKITGRNVGATATTIVDDEELSRTLWILKYPHPRETKKVAPPNSKIIYPDESEVQQRWVKEIKSSVLSQRAERAGFLHACSQPVSPRSSWLSNAGHSSSPANGWHLPLSPNKQLSFFPQARPPQPALPPPNPNPRYAEHIGAAPCSVFSNTHSTSAHPFSSRLHPPPGLRNFFQSPYSGSSHASKDDSSVATRNRNESVPHVTSRPSSRDGSGSVWNGIQVATGIQRSAITEEGEDVREMPQHQDIHPLAVAEPTEDYASFLTKLNTRLKESLKVKENGKEKEKEKKIRYRPKSAGAVSDKTPTDQTSTMNPDTFTPPAANRNETSQHLHTVFKRPNSPPNDIMSVASIYSQSSAQDHTSRETRSLKHSHKRSASTGTISTSLQSQNVAEWIASNAHVQPQGKAQEETRTDEDLKALGDHGQLRHNDRLSIGESLAISLSLNPQSRSKRRSTTISALAAAALKENWTFPPAGSPADIPDGGTTTPGRTHPYSHSSALTSYVAPPVAAATQGPHLSESNQQSLKAYPSLSPPTSIPSSARNSIDFKSRGIRGSQATSRRDSGNGKSEQSHTTHEHERENTNANTHDTPDIVVDDTNTYHSEQDCTPHPARPGPPSISSSTRSPFGRAVPLVYKRVSAPPTTSSSTSATTLPPLRPPPSFAPPPPPCDLFSNDRSPRSSPDPTTGMNFETKKATKNASGSMKKDSEMASSRLRPFRLSLNPSPPPTQPLPPRPDEILVDGTVTFIENDKRTVHQRQRPHSTLVGPRQKPYKTFTTHNNERPLFMSMRPVSVSPVIPLNGANSEHYDPSVSLAEPSVPAPQPPPKGPLPPTPKSTAAAKGRELNPELLSIFPKGYLHSSALRRLRIMSSPPAAKTGDEFSNKERVDDLKINNPRDEPAEPIRSRVLIPAPPKIPPPKPKKRSSEEPSSMLDNSSLGEQPSSVEDADSSMQVTFLHMDDTPQTSIFDPSATNTVFTNDSAACPERSLEAHMHNVELENQSTPFPQDMTREESSSSRSSRGTPAPGRTSTSDHDRNADLPQYFNDFFDDYEVHEANSRRTNELNIVGGDNIMIVTGRITPPSPPLSITGRTRTDSSNLSGHSSFQSEPSNENDDFIY